MPTAPHPAICHTVHGPCERKMLETIAVTAPTANPGTAPSAYPANRTMSVVGLTFGKAANASRPTTASAASAATTAITRAGGRSRSYQAKPHASATARRASEEACQLIAEPPPLIPNDQR